MKSIVIGGVVACLMLALIVPPGVARLQTPQASIDQKRLEEIEERSEAIANGLLELSVAVRDFETRRIPEFFADPAHLTPLPAEPAQSVTEVKWVQRRGWRFQAGVMKPTTRAEIVRQWDGFLANFSELEDVRFKLKESSFDEGLTTARSKIAFYLIGRDSRGQREWVRGTAAATVVRTAAGQWVIREMAIADLNSLVATRDLFSEVSDPAGVAATVPAYGEKGNTGFIWYGAAAGDFNRDGLMDLFVTAADRNYLYLNDGQGRFRDASVETGVKLLASGAGPLLLDYDNDGDMDVFIASVGAQVLLENRLVPDGKLELRDVSLESGVGLVSAFGFSAAAADVNGDGLSDIYVASYNRYGQVVPDSWFRATNGTPNLLFLNQGQGKFREEAVKWGVADRRWSYAAAFADVNGDGKQDLYVANDFGEKAMFINQGDRFVDEARERGVLDPGNGMGVAFGDYNNDGLLDLHATNMSSTAGNRILARLFPNQSPQDNVLKKLAAGNNLFENLGDGKFRDVTAEVGGFSGGWAWGGGFIDFDNDGWEDLYTPNGFISGKTMKDT
jgi:hypothetical protein